MLRHKGFVARSANHSWINNGSRGNTADYPRVTGTIVESTDTDRCCGHPTPAVDPRHNVGPRVNLRLAYPVCGRLRRARGGRSDRRRPTISTARAFVARERGSHMGRSLPLFAAVWLGVAVGWSVVLCLESLLTPLLAVTTLAMQAVVTGGAIAVARAEAGLPVLPVVGAASMFLGTSTIVVFAAVGGSGDFLAYVLLTLYLSAALAFMWGWRAELALLVATVIPWLLAIPAPAFTYPPSSWWPRS